MRDPVTKLAIMDSSMVDPQLVQIFPLMFMSPDKVAVIHYISRISKKTRFGMTEKCIMFITNRCVYLCKEDGARKRCIRAEKITEVCLFQDSFILFRVPDEYDIVFKLQVQTEVDYMINVLRVVRSYVSTDGTELAIKGCQGGHRDGKEWTPNLQKPAQYTPEMMEIPMLRRLESKNEALEEFLRPPQPPPVDRKLKAVGGGNVDDRVGEVLRHPLLDPKGVVQEEDHRTAAILAGSPIMKGTTGAAATVASTLESFGIGQTQSRSGMVTATSTEEAMSQDDFHDKLTRLHEAQMELQRQQSANLEAAKRLSFLATESMRRARETSHSPNGKPDVSPEPAAPNSSVKSANAVPQPRQTETISNIWQPKADIEAVQSRSQERNRGGAMPTTGQSNYSVGNSVDAADFLALRAEVQGLRQRTERDEEEMRRRDMALSEMQRKIDFLTKENEVLKNRLAVSQKRSQEREADGGAKGALKWASAGDSVHSNSAAALSAAEFEESVKNKALADRLTLRQYQIEQKREEIQKVFDGQAAYDASLVYRLQDDLIVLVKKLGEDLKACDQSLDQSTIDKLTSVSPIPAAKFERISTPSTAEGDHLKKTRELLLQHASAPSSHQQKGSGNGAATPSPLEYPQPPSRTVPPPPNNAGVISTEGASPAGAANNNSGDQWTQWYAYLYYQAAMMAQMQQQLPTTQQSRMQQEKTSRQTSRRQTTGSRSGRR